MALSFSVILGASPGIQVFIANTNLDSRLLARMTDGESGGGWLPMLGPAIGMNTAQGMTVYLLKKRHF